MPIPSGRLHEAVLTLLGLILALSPLAMWLAPTTTVLALAVTASVTSGLALWLLSQLTGGDAGRNSGLEPRHAPARLPDRFIAELHKLSPLTYHHRPLGDPRYQRKIDRLRQYLND